MIVAWIIIAFVFSNLISWCVGDSHGYWDAFNQFQEEKKKEDY